MHAALELHAQDKHAAFARCASAVRLRQGKLADFNSRSGHRVFFHWLRKDRARTTRFPARRPEGGNGALPKNFNVWEIELRS